MNLAQEPGKVAQGAMLLEEIQEHERKGEQLTRRVSAFLAGDTSSATTNGSKSLADWAEEVLKDSAGPMRYREIAAEIRGRGFQHARTPKSPDQLADSVWSAMYEDPKKRFVKVGRGIWDLVQRNSANDD
ncbi:MAG TPA: HTH domain-containing protein [Solirubrobacteraceae bacterium]|nr:HTH domain-containing protein [Solirubrobacteraceae bacterium]